MSMSSLARNRVLDAAMKTVPLAYAAISRYGVYNSKELFGSRAISTAPPSSPLHVKRYMDNHLPVSSPALGFRNFSRQFTSGRGPHDSDYRFARRTAINWGIKFVPQQEAYVIERFGKYHKVLDAGFHVLLPLVDQIAYIHSLKEQTIEIPEQPAVTTDNVSIRVNGVLFIKVIDPYSASYGNDNVLYAVTQLAQTVMRSAIGKMQLDKTFMERDTLNANIVEAINDVASQWGLTCRRYEIRDIIPPAGIRESMNMQAEAERKKRAGIIEAEGKRQAVILTSEAAKIDSINRATGEAEAINIVANALQSNGGQAAASLKVAQEYVQAFNKMAQECNTMLLPQSVGDPSSMVATALTLYKNLVVDKDGRQTFQEGSTLINSGRQMEEDNEIVEAQEKPHFSLQSPKRTQ